MSKIIGVTVGTPTSPNKMGQELKPVKTINGQTPDKNGNVAFGYATEQYVQEYAQPKGAYLTEHQDISGKMDSAELPKAVNAALAQAKASGEFKGEKGDTGATGAKGADGEPGTDGKSAYTYAQEAGYTGTETEFAEKLSKAMPSTLPNPHPLTINGKAYDGSEDVNITITGGTTGENVPIGQTPLTLSEDMAVKLVGNGDYTYTIKGKTIADIGSAGVASTLATLTNKGEYYELESTGGSAWYNSYVTLSFNGLTVGTKYVLCVKGHVVSANGGIGGSQYIIKNASGTTLVTLSGVETGNVHSIEFTPDTANITIVCYVMNYYWSKDIKVAWVYDLYINEASDGTERTDIINESGTFTDTYSLGVVSKGVTIATTPSCEVYAISGDSENAASLPLAGKTVVCFGDSLFGMYTGDTSAPAYVAQKTGATVHNVGFGGCRMSEHPYPEYNAFSMYALANAISSGDWSLQDTNAANGSANFPDQLAILKGIDFNDVDYVVIHYGTNDFTAGGGVAIDNASNPKATNTLCGALRHSVETLLGAFPKLKIFVSLPAFRYWTADNGTVTYSDTWKNVNGHTLPDFVKALADTAKEYKLPVIDCYYGLGINKSNAATFLADGTHHNIDGRKRFGEYIGAKLISEGDTFHGSDSESGSGGSDSHGIPYIVGDGTTAGTWTGTCEDITEYYEGLTILYKLNVAGASGGTTLNINGLGAIAVNRNASTAVTTIYPVGSVLLLTYSEGAWLIADYDANSKNTAGTSAKAGTKMYIVGATSQTSSGTTTYTNSNVYIGTDNELYSNGKKVAKEENIPDVSGMVKSVNGATPDANGNVTVATGGSGGSGVDVTASVGQTIVVEEVDANGKPTKWKAAEYQLVENEIIPQTTYAGTYDSSYGCFMYYLPNATVLIQGKKYTVVFDGVEYTCTAQSATIGNMALTFIGNGALLGNNTGEPFALANIVGYDGYIICMGFDGNQHSVRVYEVKLHDDYLPQAAYPYYIEATDTKNGNDRVVINDTAANILSVYKSGRPLIIALDISEDSTQQKKYFNLIQAGIVAGDWSMIFVCAIPSSGSTNLSAAESITIYYVDGEMNVVERLEW